MFADGIVFIGISMFADGISIHGISRPMTDVTLFFHVFPIDHTITFTNESLVSACKTCNQNAYAPQGVCYSITAHGNM